MVRFGVPAARVFSLYVVQAGSARAAGSGRACPTAFNRAGEKPQATGESCPGCQMGLVPNVRAGSLSPSSGRKVKGTRSGAGGWERWSGGLRLVVRGVMPAGGAGSNGGIPAGAVDDQAVDPAQQGGGAGDAGPGAPGAGRGLRRRALL